MPKPPSVYNVSGIVPERPRRPDMCLRIGKLSIKDRIGGLHRADVPGLIDDMLQAAGQVLQHTGTQLSAPIAACFKPHEVLPLEQLLGGSISSAANVTSPGLSQPQQQVLLTQFFVAVFPVCSIASRADAVGNDLPTQALRLAMLYAAAASLLPADCETRLALPRELLLKQLKGAYEAYFGQLGIFEYPEVKSFQSILIYLTPQVVSEVSRSHSILLATITRQFQVAGSHRDDASDYNITRQLKRHLWQHLLFLNIRATEAVGPEASLVDDPDASMPSLDCQEYPYPYQQSVSPVVAIIRYECYKLHRIIFRERENVKQGRTLYDQTVQKLDLHA